MGHSNCDKCGHDTKMCDCPKDINTEHANDRQVGGDHYKSDYQHWDWGIDVNIGSLEYAASKYVSRWWKKNGVQDVEKAKHYVQKAKDEFLARRYPNGFSRLKDVSMSAYKTMQFGQKNELDEAESLFCWLMASWETAESLDEAMNMLDYIIKNPQKAAGKRRGRSTAGGRQRGLTVATKVQSARKGCKMIGKLLASVIWSMVPPKRPPDFLIGPNPEDPYMRRWWIIPRNKIFNIYLHHMRHDDDDRAPHDHPWWSLSLCLNGYIQEMELLPRMFEDSPQQFRQNHIRKGDWKWRGKEYAHFLKLPEGDAWTLFITGPKIRKWGFHCPKGWLPWDKFVDPTDPGKPGRGCGELS